MSQNSETSTRPLTHNMHFEITLTQGQDARLQQYVNHELPDGQAGFRKGRGTRDQIANICWIIEKAREFQKSIYSVSLTTQKPFDFSNKLKNS